MQTLPVSQSSPRATATSAPLPHDSHARSLPSAGGGRLSWFALGLLVLFAVLSIGTARAAPPGGADDVGAGGLWLHGAGGLVEAPRVSTDVSMTINGLIARVSVRQSFRNDSADWVEGVYRFPLPPTAAVDRLTMNVGERVIVGQIQAKAKARKTYTTAKRSGRKASLVEQQRANLFTNSVANIGPGETVVVAIEYQQSVAYDQGNFSVRFPMAITPRYTPPPSSAGPVVVDAVRRVLDEHGDGADVPTDVADGYCTGSACARASVRVALNAGFALESLNSAYHPVDHYEVGGQHQVTLRGGDALMDRDFELTWRAATGSEPVAAVFTEEVDGEHYALVMFVPPNVASGPALPRELVLVIDRSGSMGGTSIVQARAALGQALDRLTPRDRFNVIAFDSDALALFEQPEYADGLALDTARRFVDSLAAQGGTNMHAALDLAFDRAATERAHADGYLRQIVFITDGSVSNEDALFAMIDQRLGSSRLFTVGIGAAPNSYFMRKAAQFGRGTFTYVGALTEVQNKMGSLLSKLENPALTDIDVAWPVAVMDKQAPVRDLYLGEPVIATARLAAAPTGVTVRGAGQFQKSLAVRGQGAPGVGALWARERISALMDQRLVTRDRDAIERQVTQIALKHNLVSAFTSLVAVDQTPTRPAGVAAPMRKVSGVLPAGMAATSGYPQGATSWQFMILLGGLCLLAPFLLRFGWRT